MIRNQETKILLLQGPSSGGKSSFLYGFNNDGYLVRVIDTFLGEKQKSNEQLHVIVSAYEVRQNDKCYDLLSDSGSPLVVKGYHSKTGQGWSPTGATDCLVTGSEQFMGLLAEVSSRLDVDDNGVHGKSSRGFTIYKIVSSTRSV